MCGLNQHNAAEKRVRVYGYLEVVHDAHCDEESERVGENGDDAVETLLRILRLVLGADVVVESIEQRDEQSGNHDVAKTYTRKLWIIASAPNPPSMPCFEASSHPLRSRS